MVHVYQGYSIACRIFEFFRVKISPYAKYEAKEIWRKAAL